jgi:molybdopterin biosynthesis enzyme
VAECGGEPIQLGIAKDTGEASMKLSLAMKADCIISSEGVSVRDYDFVRTFAGWGSSMIF